LARVGYLYERGESATIRGHTESTMEEDQKKKVRPFRSSREKSPREILTQRVERLWELLDADYATLKRESKINHPMLLSTLERVREELEEMQTAYETLLGGK